MGSGHLVHHLGLSIDTVSPVLNDRRDVIADTPVSFTAWLTLSGDRSPST